MLAKLLTVRGIAIATAAALAVGGFAGHRAGKNSVLADWNADKARHSAAMTKLEREHRQREAMLNERAQKVEDALTAAQAATLEELDTSLAGLRADNLRLRQRFRACSAVPETTGTTSGDDGTRESGLSDADQELALRIGADADRVAHKLAACQAYVRAIL